MVQPKRKRKSEAKASELGSSTSSAPTVGIPSVRSNGVKFLGASVGPASEVSASRAGLRRGAGLSHLRTATCSNELKAPHLVQGAHISWTFGSLWLEGPCQRRFVFMLTRKAGFRIKKGPKNCWLPTV